MYEVSDLEVFVVKRVRETPAAAARLERMLGAMTPRHVTEVDDAGLDELVRARGWSEPSRRTGEYRMTGPPTLIFNAFRWLKPEAFGQLGDEHPALRGHMFLGDGPWTFRDHRHFRRDYDCVCQSAWEIHSAYGCLHNCDYCHVAPFFNIMVNLEEFAERVRAFGESVPEQSLYKFDNQTDTVTLEPEYGASEVMVNAFADWPGRYLMLYTKSDNVEHLLDLNHNGHTLVSWSLNAPTPASLIEKNTPSLDARLRAMERCQGAGYRVRARISPICPVKGWRDEYAEMAARLLERVRPDVITVDVVGWMSARQMRNALELALFDDAYAEVVVRLDEDGVQTRGKHLFPHEMRADLLRHVIGAIRRLRPEQAVSICNETPAMWRELGPLMGMNPDNYACCCGPDSVPGHPLLALSSPKCVSR